jgi:beta-N-acetylhexosaminidase
VSLEGAALGVLMASWAGAEPPPWLLRRIEAGLGSVCLYAGNVLDGGPLHEAGAGVVVAVDEEGGDVTRIEAAAGSSVPGAAALGAVDDAGLTGDVAAALGVALADRGIDLDLAPVADVNVDAANPVIGVRSFGADAGLVARHVAATVDGLGQAGVAACAKHFPGHGATTVDSHVGLPVVHGPLDLAPFAAAVAAGVAAVMTGHLVVPDLDDRPATVSPAAHRLLRHDLGFDGVVVTDALDMAGAGGPAAIPATAVAALAAGADLCCLGPAAGDDLVEACLRAVVGAVRSGRLAGDRLAEAAGRVRGLAARRRDRADAPAHGATGGRSLAEVGAEAARRALLVDPDLRLPVLGAHVVEVDRPAMIAAGAVPWGVARPLARLDPTSTGERLDGPAAVPAAVARAAGRRLVVAVRDPHRSPEAGAALAALLAARPDAVVVDLGWPAAPAHITTFGASRASGEAVARVLAGVAAPLARSHRG